MSELEIKRLHMQVKKADAVIAELELKIEERNEDIQRMKDHIEVQKKIMVDSTAQLQQVADAAKVS